MTERYAYGTNSFEGVPCPATAAGKNYKCLPTVVEQYDQILTESKEYGVGFVDADRAQEVWDEAIQKVSVGADKPSDVELAKEIREELWGDDD